MIPAVALRHPEEFVGLVEPPQVELPRIVNERLAPLIDQRSDRAVRRIHGDDAQHLMTPLVVDKGESAGVVRPPDVPEPPRIREHFV